MASVMAAGAKRSVSMRVAYGEALRELGTQRSDVVVLSADVANSDHSYMFAEAFPDRFYNVGIAEPALVDIAVGLAKSGSLPFANTFAFLFATRAVEMVRTHVCYGRANVKLAGAYAGISDSFDGPTHHSITDLAIMRSLPNMSVVVPSDPVSLKHLLPKIASYPGPVFFRLCRNEVPVLFTNEYETEVGETVVLREGSDLTVFCCGTMVAPALVAAEELAQGGVSSEVVEVHTIKPLDQDAIAQSVAKTGAAVTCEEHSVIGGLGGAIAEVLVARRPVPMERVGIQDTFCESGPYAAILDKYGLSSSEIVSASRRVLERKGR